MKVTFHATEIAEQICHKTNGVFELEKFQAFDDHSYSEVVLKNYKIKDMMIVFGCFESNAQIIFLQDGCRRTRLTCCNSPECEAYRQQILAEVTKKLKTTQLLVR